MENTCHIYWLDEVDSTNLEALRRISADSEGSANMSVIAARSQYSGKGQGDHTWLTSPGKNLTFTIILRYDEDTCTVPASEQHAVSALTALSVVDYLATKGIRANIKLENDIYVGDSVASGLKICGILIKHHVRGAFLKDSVLGIGININQLTFPASLPNPTSVALQLGSKGEMDVEDELRGFTKCFEKLYPSLNSEGGRRSLEERFASLIIR